MTKLFAEIMDFKLIYEGDEIVAYQFRFGKCDNWTETFGNFKGMIQMQNRTPYPEKNWLWEVKHTAQTRKVMAHLFDNFENCWQTAASQLKMF